MFSIKNIGIDKVFKSRYIVQGHLDRKKAFLVYTSSIVSQQFIGLLRSIASIFGFSIWSEDMILAYIFKGTEEILRKVSVWGEPELQLKSNELLELLPPFYGLGDSGDYWHSTFLRQLKNVLGMTTAACNLSLLFKRIQSSLHAMIATYVDDTLRAGTAKLELETMVPGQRFDAKPRRSTP